MAITVESTSFARGDKQDSITVTAPTGIATGDLLLMIVSLGVDGDVTSTDFTESFNYSPPYTAGFSGRHTVLYKYAVLADESETGYTVTNGTIGAEYFGNVHMFRISGGFTTGDPVYQHTNGSSVISISGGLDVDESVSISRPSAQLNMIIAAAWSKDSLINAITNTNFNITSSDSNPAWTFLGDDTDYSYTPSLSWDGKTSVAYVESTDTSEVTGYSFDYNETLSDLATASYTFLTLHTPAGGSDSNTLLETDTILFEGSGVTNTSASNTLLETSPTVPTQTGEGIQPTSWTPTIKS